MTPESLPTRPSEPSPADTDNAFVRSLTEKSYEYGFTTQVDTDILQKGLGEDTVREISRRKGEPDWLLEFRLRAFRHWQTLRQPTWGHVSLPPIDYQAISYYADPTKTAKAPRTSTPNCSRRSTNWAYPSRSAWRWPEWPSTPSWTASA